jgi:HTH-type transcriptional regulator / antitoxin HigA
MQTLDINKTAAAWAPFTRTLIVPQPEPEYRQLVELLDSLIDEVAEDKSILSLQ